MGLKNWLFGDNRNLSIERDKAGNWFYWWGTETPFSGKKSYLKWSLSNPVLMTTISLRSKLLSQMQITAVNDKGESVEIPELELLYNPNYFQSKEDFFYQMGWYESAMGYCYTYQSRPFVSEVPKALFNLIPDKYDIKDVLKIEKFITTQQDINEFEKRTIKYEFEKEKKNILIRDIIPFYDMPNGLTSCEPMKGSSRIDGIKEPLCNIEENMKAKNINLKFSQKYLARNNNGESMPPQIQEADRKAIERTFDAKHLHVTNANIEVTHLIKDLKNLALDPMFSQDALVVLMAFELNKDVLNYQYGGASTYDNQNIGLVSFIQNSIQPWADNIMNSFSTSWKLRERGVKLKASYNHLPVMQSLVNSKVDTLSKLTSSLNEAVAGNIISVQDAKEQYNKTKTQLGL